jgi:hypothetical protein
MKTQRLCCDGQCDQGRNCPALPIEQPAKIVSLDRRKRWDMPPFEDTLPDPGKVVWLHQNDFDHDEGPGLLASRWFVGSLVVCTLCVALLAWWRAA